MSPFTPHPYQLLVDFSSLYLQGKHVTGFAQQRQQRGPPTPPAHTHTAAPWKPALTQDSTLRMVCGCLAKVIGSIVDPDRPAPNDPTPSIFCRSVCALLAAPRSRLHGRMDALLLLAAVGTGPARSQTARGRSVENVQEPERAHATDERDRPFMPELTLMLLHRNKTG